MIEKACNIMMGVILLIFGIIILINANEMLAYAFGGILLALVLGLFYKIVKIEPKKKINYL